MEKTYAWKDLPLPVCRQAAPAPEQHSTTTAGQEYMFQDDNKQIAQACALWT